MKKILLEEGHYYHIFNRGNNGDNIFYETENYYYFLKLYAKYIEPVADTFAWVLLKNHFHLLIYVKPLSTIDKKSLSYSTTKQPREINATRQFSHLFNAYTQAINKRHHRSGSLFEKTFKRKLVSSEKYFQNLIYYIHNNPVKHGFVDSMIEYPWSSYDSILSSKKTNLKRKEVLHIFDDASNFISYHAKEQSLYNINDLLIE